MVESKEFDIIRIKMTWARKREDSFAVEAHLRELDMLAKLKCEETGWWKDDRLGLYGNKNH